tara:strand:- start:1186 stop:1707 length:522 start_codon:yes stop_codon:yes gene_type:complete
MIIVMSDKEYYQIATKEFEEGKIDEFLWAKVMTLAEGDEVKAKWKYIKLRTEELTEEQRQLIKIQIKDKWRLSLKTLTKAVDGAVGLVIFIYSVTSLFLIFGNELLKIRYVYEAFLFVLGVIVAPIVYVFLMSFILNAIFQPSNAIEFHKKFILTIISIAAACMAMAIFMLTK